MWQLAMHLSNMQAERYTVADICKESIKHTHKAEQAKLPVLLSHAPILCVSMPFHEGPKRTLVSRVQDLYQSEDSC